MPSPDRKLRCNLVYGLYDPLEPWHIRYIGQSTNLARPESHLHDAKYSDKPLYRLDWIRGVLREGRIPEWVALDFADSPSELSKKECLLIEKYRILGHRLTNLTAGGETGPSPEVAVRIGRAQKGRVFSAEHRRRLSESKKGRKPANWEAFSRAGQTSEKSKEHARQLCNKRAEECKGVSLSEDHKRAISDGLLRHAHEKRLPFLTIREEVFVPGKSYYFDISEA